MKLLKDGTYVIETDNRILELTKEERQAKVSEDEFCTALKGYRLDEFLTALAEISVKLFDPRFTGNEIWKKEKDGFIIHKPSKQFVTDFAIEYIANILLISGSNSFKRESIKNKDNIIGLFSIYHNSIMQQTDRINSAQSILVPIFYQQITSQQNIKDVFVRQWLIFQKSQDLVNNKKKINLDQILINESGISVIEYIKLCFLILAVILTKPRFSFGTFENSTIYALSDVLNKQKITAIFKQLSATQDESRIYKKSIQSSMGKTYY